MLEIRPFTAQDYPVLKLIWDSCWPDQKLSLEELKVSHNLRRPDLVCLEFLALEDALPIGWITASQDEWRLESGAYFANLMVHPGARGRGIGKALYGHLRHELEPHNPGFVWCMTQEGQTRARHFLGARGWKEYNRSWESWLDLGRFDPQRFAGALNCVLEGGYRITTFDVLERENPQARRKLYDLECQANEDIPAPKGDTFEFRSFERYWERLSEKLNYRPELWFVALSSSGDLAGVSQLYLREADADLDTGLTGTARAHRRKGVALALKLKAIEYALERGARRLRTNNSQANRPMLAINEALGFEKQPAWMEYHLEWET